MMKKNDAEDDNNDDNNNDNDYDYDNDDDYNHIDDYYNNGDEDDNGGYDNYHNYYSIYYDSGFSSFSVNCHERPNIGHAKIKSSENISSYFLSLQVS